MGNGNRNRSRMTVQKAKLCLKKDLSEELTTGARKDPKCSANTPGEEVKAAGDSRQGDQGGAQERLHPWWN